MINFRNIFCVGSCLKRRCSSEEPLDSKHKFRDGLYQLFVSIGALSLFIHSGIYLTFPTILYPQLNITEYQDAWIASLLTIGSVIGSFFQGRICDKFGRKRTCIFTAVLISATWAMTAFLPKDFHLHLLYIIRFISGLAMAMTSSTIVYVSETTNKHWRPVCLALMNVFMSIGIPVSAVVGSMVPWRSFALFSCAISVISFFILLPVPDSPHWLLRSSPKRAKEALMKLNKNEQDFDEEWAGLEARKLTQDSLKFKEPSLFSREVRRPMLRLALLFTFQQLSGIYLVLSYALQIIHAVTETASPTLSVTSTSNATLPNPVTRHQFHLGDVDTLSFIGAGVIRVVMATLTTFLTKHIDNRHLLITSSAGGAVFAFAFAAVFSGVFGAVSPLVPLVFTLLFQLFLSYGMLVIPWTQIGELIPLSYRAKGSGLMTAHVDLVMSVVFMAYPYANDWVGLTGVFTFFGVTSILACFFIYYYIPETRGRTFAEIEEYFK